MENQKKIIVSGVVIVAIIALAIIGLVIINNKKNIQTPKETKEVGDTYQKEIIKNKIQNIKGKVLSIDIGAAKIISNDGEELNLKISQKGVSLLKQIKQGDGNGLLKEISLSEVPLNQEVDIQYNSQDNELMLIMIKMIQ